MAIKTTETSAAITIGELIHQRTADLTPAERRVARTLFSTNLMAGFDTVAELAQRSQVSGPTIVRFASKLGFAGYPEFQRALRSDLAARIDSPLRLYGKSSPEQPGGELLDHVRDVFVHGLESMFANLPPPEFAAVVEILADRKRPVWMTGGRFTQACAEMLQAHLYQLRPNCQVIAYTPAGRADALLDVARRDVLLVFDVRRYQKDTIALTRTAKAQGATVVLITDPWLSPIADLADHVLTVDVEAPSPYDSMVPSVALVEALVAGVVAKLGKTTRSRISNLERLREGYTWDDQALSISGEDD
ncbi:MAG: MurR/RpiR family transcriptional regulator [Rhodospirillaceae bacterium]|nr:MurR/RpiR family transcriptional regulator [Rhodospirillaceae bacterium]MBT6206146.1 MurR/RpiR family transcriptional regulator [Rhodospirillaceae bacterium]MBT6512138.1 MurR/RpiR family transcriptional regulator [Rhodospirillaceae bacterium]MBT7613577.1 MurR/RpiR family transcriptional regulator [Rhodospirillaceae bacterium]